MPTYLNLSRLLMGCKESNQTNKSNNMFLTLNEPAKIDSADVVCCIYLLSSLTKVRVEANSVDPDQTAPTGAV